MGEISLRSVSDETIAAYREAAAADGRSLEAELHDLIERNRPLRRKSPAELLKLADDLQAMTPEGPDGSDSTLFIRWDRDTITGYGSSARHPA